MKIFGFNNFKEDGNLIEQNYPVQNVLNILGWFPFLGTIIGAIRIGTTIVICVVDEDSGKYKHKKYYALSTVRGVVEIFCLGFFFVIPDIITSLTRARARKTKEIKEKEKEKEKDKEIKEGTIIL